MGETRDRQERSRVTIDDVSAALGLSKSTVSRALNNYPDISKATRQRVAAMAEQMGYRPLSQAQTIRTGRSRALGLVIQMDQHDSHRPFLAEFLAGVSAAASARGWTLTVTTSDSPAATLRTFRQLWTDRKADGFILPRTRLEDDRIDLLRGLGVPFVLFGRTADPTGCAWYDLRGETAIKRAVTRLAELGHRKIAYLGGAEGFTYSTLRREGFAEGMAEAGLPVVETLVADNVFDETRGAEEAARMLRSETPPTAFVCALDRAALGIYETAARLDLAIGRDLSIIGYDGTRDAETAQPALSTHVVDVRRAGEQLGELLIRRIRGEAVEILRLEEEARFLDRGSIGPVPTGNT